MKARPKVILPPEQIPIEVRIESCSPGCRKRRRADFQELFADVKTRAGMIVTFLALLEMIRLKMVRVFQQGASADSCLQARQAGGRATV